MWRWLPAGVFTSGRAKGKFAARMPLGLARDKGALQERRTSMFQFLVLPQVTSKRDSSTARPGASRKGKCTGRFARNDDQRSLRRAAPHGLGRMA